MRALSIDIRPADFLLSWIDDNNLLFLSSLFTFHFSSQLHCVVLCCAVLCCAVLCCAVLFCCIGLRWRALG